MCLNRVWLSEIVFKDVWKFGKENPIIGSLLSETEVEKFTDELAKTFGNTKTSWKLKKI